ncbi:MAG: hypothetical protein WC683_09870 [bacterium]
MSLFGSQHRIQVSTTKQDAVAAETRDVRFKGPQSGHNTATANIERYTGDMEAGMATHLPDAIGTPIAAEWSKQLTFAADDATVPFFLFYVSCKGDADSTSAQLDTSSGVFEHAWTGPSVAGDVLAFSLEDLGQPGTDDADFNRLVSTVTPQSVEIAGSRRGVCTVTTSLLGGSTTTAAAGTTIASANRNCLFTFSMSHIFTSTAVGVGATSTWGAHANGLDTDAEVLAATHLNATASSLTPYLHEFKVVGTRDIDMTRSMAPGNFDSSYAAVVPTCGDYIMGPKQQQLELELLFEQNGDAGGVIEGLRAEYDAGTLRPWEFWLVHPLAHAGGASFAYNFLKVTMASGHPISWKEENDGFGERFVRVRYQGGYDTTDAMGWHIAAGSTSLVTDLGA